MNNDEYQAFAARELGPASYRLLQSEVGVKDLVRRTAQQVELADAVLGVVFDALRRRGEDSALAEEFFTYLLPHAESHSHGRIGASLRRHLESRDIAQSVFGNLWQDIPDLEFTTFPQFLSMVVKRINWKVSNRGRDLNRGKRSEGERVDLDVEDLVPNERSSNEQMDGVWQEDVDVLLETVMSLPNERDRKLILGRISGLTLEEIASSLDLEVSSARRALNRAIERARAHFNEAQEGRSDGGFPPAP
jgi:RNA polymerase sigma factor (sigma-70 family)